MAKTSVVSKSALVDEGGPDYEADFYGWALHQADLLRAGKFGALDLQRLAEEIEGVAKSEVHSLTSNLTVLLLHMLKWDYQATRRTRSWSLSIAEHRRRVDRILGGSPTLRSRIDEHIDSSYGDAILRAARETGLPLTTFPGECPYTMIEVRERVFPID